MNVIAKSQDSDGLYPDPTFEKSPDLEVDPTLEKKTEPDSNDFFSNTFDLSLFSFVIKVNITDFTLYYHFG